MSKLSSLTNETAVVNHGEAMVAETISKNGDSLKIHRSKVNLLNFLFVVVITVSTMFTSCSSPESDGIKAAKADCDCNKKYPLVGRFDFDFYIPDEIFDDTKMTEAELKEQEEAKLKEQEINKKRKEQKEPYKKCMSKANELRNKLSEKYRTNKEKNSQFEYAIKEYRCEQVK